MDAEGPAALLLTFGFTLNVKEEKTGTKTVFS
jgi:hypothetical protein